MKPIFALAVGLAWLTLAGTSPTAAADPFAPAPYVGLTHPAWTRNATIYELNTRQFTAEGTIKAAQTQLPRIKALGADIVWLMPIQPIGQKNRKGTLGSPYSIRDYRAVNPELGTLADLKAFVAQAHRLGLHVILDWVGNHTAWDNPMLAEHPDWYDRDWKGDPHPTPWWDWSDIIDLDYSKPALRRYMTESMAYWVREADVDGFRADAAGFVPLDFWETARARLDRIKPVFLLAEWEARDMHMKAFDMTYAWTWGDAVQQIAQGKADVGALRTYYSWNQKAWPSGALRMLGVTNHDKNAWEGTEFERLGSAVDAAIALSVVSEGVPLIYGSQEAGIHHRLAFFERDPIVWRDDPEGDLYRRLFALKKAHPALANAPWGGRMIDAVNDAPDKVLSFVRDKDGDRVLGVFNLSAGARRVRFLDRLPEGRYTDFASGAPVTIDGATVLDMPAWSYRILLRTP